MKETNKLEGLFESYARGRSYAQAFDGLLDFLTLPLRIYDSAEERQAALGALAKGPNVGELLALAAEIGERSEGFRDPLGALYERLVSKGHNGQYFTPDHIAELMVEMTAPEEGRERESVLDPACGSGRMLLAAARRNRHLRLYGADVDPACCRMALANMLLNSLAGEIAHMDSLSNEFYRGYRIGTFLKDGYHHPYYVEFADPKESAIWRRPGPKASAQGFSEPFEPKQSASGQGVQGTLF